MNKELLMVFLPGISWILFALGGTQISATTQGWKGWRRFILPFVYGIFCVISQIVWWKVLLVMVLADIIYSLPYGHKITWKLRWIIAAAYGLISIPIGMSFWNFITPIGFSVLFLLSNFKTTSSTFVWKICEGGFGLLVGIQLSYLLTGNGILWR